MKIAGILLWVGVLLSSSCGDTEKDADPVRIGKPGTILEGPAGGRDSYVFPDGSSISLVVSGTMNITIPKGIFRGTAFPADVTYAVRSVNGGVIKGSVSFPRLVINNEGRFDGNFSNGVTVAVITGLFSGDSTAASIDVQGFSANVPTTDTSIKTRTVILQGQLNARQLETQ